MSEVFLTVHHSIELFHQPTLMFSTSVLGRRLQRAKIPDAA